MGDWYLQTDSDQYGPYTWEEVKELSANGRLHASDLLWDSKTNQWRSAGEFRELFHQPAPQPQRQTSTPKTKKRRGCGCLTVLGVMAAFFFVCIAGLIFSLILLNNRPSSKMTVGKAIQATTERIDSQGGVLSIDQPGDPLDGFMIDVPPGAYDKPVNFKVSYHPIENHDLGPHFTPITPLIHVDNGGGYASEPMTITLPVPDHPDYFTMAFFYDRKTGELEGMPLIDAGDGTITLATRHFSDFVASTIRIDELQRNLDIDTGFRPGVDDWQFRNRGSWASPNGHCAGQAISTMWYFYERRAPGERPLYGRYDNNDRGYGTIDFWQDDSWGYRLASAVQRDINWENYTRETLLQLRGYHDPTSFMAFAYAMLLTEMPQYVGIASSTSSSGHAIIAYRLEQNKLYVADPNYPGDERVIQYVNNRFQPYNSGENADAIAQGNGIAYDKIGYFAVTALVDWDQVGLRWSQLEGGRSGDEYFNNYQLVYQADKNPNTSLRPLVDGMSISKADTEKTGSSLVGKIHVIMLSDECRPRLTVYRGVSKGPNSLDGRQLYCTAKLTIDLEEGVNDLGFLIEESKSGWRYVDFQRFIVIYNEVDLTGTWVGHLTIEEADLFIKKIEDIFVFFFDPLFKEVFDYEGDTRQLFRDSLDPVGIGVPFDFAFQVEAIPGEENQYIVYTSSVDEYGTLHEDRSRASFEDGLFRFHVGQLMSSGFALEGRLVDNDTLSGTFIIKEWFGNLGSGVWEVERVE